MSQDVLSVREFAEEFGVAKSTIYALCEAQAIPHIRFGAAIRFRREAIENWIALQEQASMDANKTGLHSSERV